MSQSYSGDGRRRRIVWIAGVCIAVLGAGAAAAALWTTGIWPHEQAAGASAAGSDPGSEKAAAKRPRFPYMRLEAVYAGPFADTIIQRWRDPIDGRVCYLYVPVRVKHEPVKDKNDLVDYGGRSIGTISCSGPVVVPRNPQQQAPQEKPQDRPPADQKK